MLVFISVSKCEHVYVCLSSKAGLAFPYLKNRKVLENGVHHVLFREMLEFEDEVDHVFTHWRPIDLIDVPTAFVSGVFSLEFLDDLLPETAHFGRALDFHVLSAFITICPEFDQEERVAWSLLEEFLQPAILFRKLVLDLPHINGLQLRVTIRGCTTNVDEQVLIVRGVLVSLLVDIGRELKEA
ncbi:hypothetical protein TCAL_15726, partial [Tigriopus californicus]